MTRELSDESKKSWKSVERKTESLFKVDYCSIL